MSDPLATSRVLHLDEPGVARALAEHEVLVVAFWAPWCGPCQAFAPVFESVAEETGDAVFGKVNVDAEPSLAAQFGVRSIPSVMGVREGVVLYLQPGALSAADLVALVGHLRAVDMDKVRAALATSPESDAGA
ncbi:MAG: thioredoxin family protein [Gammaproteobacteria bacterium]|nr:thioredoxin family protein [Gammaproteobacteria bacterium]